MQKVGTIFIESQTKYFKKKTCRFGEMFIAGYGVVNGKIHTYKITDNKEIQTILNNISSSSSLYQYYIQNGFDYAILNNISSSSIYQYYIQNGFDYAIYNIINKRKVGPHASMCNSFVSSTVSSIRLCNAAHYDINNTINWLVTWTHDNEGYAVYC